MIHWTLVNPGGDSGFMPHDWRTKVKIYWICSLALAKWRLGVFSGFSPSLNDRVQSLAGGQERVTLQSCSLCGHHHVSQERRGNKPITAACRKGNPSILVDPGFIKIYTRFHLLLQHEARLYTHQQFLTTRKKLKHLILKNRYSTDTFYCLWPHMRVSLS